MVAIERCPDSCQLGVKEVLNTVPNTSEEKKIIESIEENAANVVGVSVLGPNSGKEENIFEKAQKKSGNGHGNGEELDLDERWKDLANEFSVLLNPKTTLAPPSLQEKMQAL